MSAPVASLVVLSVPQIVRQYAVTSDEFLALVAALRGKEKRLMTGSPGFFLSDVKEALGHIRNSNDAMV